MKADVLKKHHYWIVAGVSVVLVLVAFFSLGSVGTAIEAKQGDIKKAEGETSKVLAPGKVALTAIDGQKKILETKKDDLWRENWERQKSLFLWPEAPGKPFAEYESLKFGADLPSWSNEDTKYETFKKVEVYKATYDALAESIKPTKFNGSIQNVLGDRYVATWAEKKPEPRQIWLALEDIWVTRSLLEPIRYVNETARAFTLASGDVPSGPLKKTFFNSTWQVDLEVITKDQAKVVTGKLKNRTGQMQLLGTDNRLKLKVWLDAESKNPFEFEVQGEYVPGGEATNIPLTPVPSGTTVTEIVKLEQVPDARTAPIRLVDKISLTLIPNQFGAYGKLPPLPPSFWPDEGDAAAAAAGAPAPVAAAGPPLGLRGEGGGGGLAAGGASAGAGARGTIEGATTANRKRYLEVTGQLRRMPVAIKLVLDYRYMQDVMVAYTNSPLRLQLVQYHWARYRGNLGDSTAPGSTGGGGSGVATSGNVSSDAPMIRGDLGAEFGRRGEGRRGGEGGPPIASPQLPGAPPAAIPGLTGGVLTSVSEAQANSALIELYLFGVITIYEKPEPKKDAAGTVAPVVPKADAPKTDTTMPETPMPKPDAPKPETPMNKEAAPMPTEPKKDK